MPAAIAARSATAISAGVRSAWSSMGMARKLSPPPWDAQPTSPVIVCELARSRRMARRRGGRGDEAAPSTQYSSRWSCREYLTTVEVDGAAGIGHGLPATGRDLAHGQLKPAAARRLRLTLRDEGCSTAQGGGCSSVG